MYNYYVLNKKFKYALMMGMVVHPLILIWEAVRCISVSLR